ncbi:hypothetical protein CSW98_00810 [Vibrio sp. HA2012]|uniref:hypothetical protein n=1 Tax=Vibrio sp. HA2012 TaxID=1971595 RepID=UPI000C2BD22C|nr:hypothetical protein [Vibrio sp. HA2012]PJC87701.1 hypothetical protein CSW98_00810 [Vibrio sp. HA2012]
MFDINSKMIKRLDWIDPSNKEQVNWICSYLKAKNWTDGGDIDQLVDLIGEFREYALKLPETADTREALRNMKAAWKQWAKRESNRRSKEFAEGAYTISLEAREELNKLAMQNGCSLSQVIETLLINAAEIDHLQKELQTEVKRAKDKRLHRFNSDFLSTFFSSTPIQEQVKLLTQNIENQKADEEKKHQEQMEKSLNAIKDKAEKIISLETEVK